MGSDPPAPDLGAIRKRLLAKCPRTDKPEDLAYLGVWSEDLRALLAAYDAQASRLADAQTAGDADPALYHDMESLRRRAPFAYGQWRADLAFLLETVDAQAARLAAYRTVLQHVAHGVADDYPKRIRDAARAVLEKYDA